MKFLLINHKNYLLYESLVIFAEKYFNSKIRTPKCEYEKIFVDRSSLTFLCLDKDNYVGNISGYALNKKSFYLFSIIVLPEHRKKGYAKRMFKFFINKVKCKDYVYLKGHFNFRSQQLVLPYNPILIKTEKRWQGTQEEYKYLKIDLRRIK